MKVKHILEMDSSNIAGLETGSVVPIKLAGKILDATVDGFRKTGNDMYLVLFTVNGKRRDASVEAFKNLMNAAKG